MTYWALPMKWVHPGCEAKVTFLHCCCILTSTELTMPTITDWKFIIAKSILCIKKWQLLDNSQDLKSKVPWKVTFIFLSRDDAGWLPSSPSSTSSAVASTEAFGDKSNKSVVIGLFLNKLKEDARLSTAFQNFFRWIIFIFAKAASTTARSLWSNLIKVVISAYCFRAVAMSLDKRFDECNQSSSSDSATLGPPTLLQTI